MRPLRTVLALAAIVATAAAVADAAAARTIRAAGTVEALGVTGGEVAYAARYRPGCFEIRVWHTVDRGVRRYASHCFVATSTGSGVSQIAVSRGRALWVTYSGGNIREYSLWTKTRTSKARRLRFLTADVDGPAPVLVGTADENALVYAVGSTVIALAPNGARLLAWHAPAAVRFVTAQGERHTAFLADGRIYTLDDKGAARLETTRDSTTLVAAVWSATGLLVHSRGAFAASQTYAVAANASYEGWANGLYAYTSGRTLRLLRARDGRDIAYARVGAPALGGYDRLGLAYASGRAVTFDARATVSALVAAG